MGAERASFPMGMMARLLGVSRSGFYDWVRRRRDDPWEAAREAVRACWEASRGRFGVFSQVSLAEKSAPFFRVSARKFFGFRRRHAPSFLTCRA